MIQDTIKDVHSILFPSMSIIKDIVEKEVPDIWRVGKLDTATEAYNCISLRKNRKTSKKSEKIDVEAAKAFNI